jgi:hypothetical protein
MNYCVRDVLQALDKLSGGRCVMNQEDLTEGCKPHVITKSSNIFGKAVIETPGLVWGNPEMVVKKVAVMMTLTESAIELAAATGINVIVAHHPIADAANSGGVLLKYYLDLYDIAVFELHEAFHGLHTGIPFLHGHKPLLCDANYGGIPDNIAYVGETLPEVKTVGDMVDRLNQYMNIETEEQMLASEQNLRKCENILETTTSARCKILLGTRDKPMKKVIHIFPHTGFNAKHLESLMTEYPDVDTLLATISRVYPGNELISKAKFYGLNFICGNSHASEIYENGLPLAYAIRQQLPEAEIVVFRERVTSTPLDEFGSDKIRDYAKEMASNHLTNSKEAKVSIAKHS